jgi:hypothetical protein
MKLMGIIVVLVGIGTASGLARIGDTIEELRKRYGAASHLHDEEGGLTVVEYEKPPFSLKFKLLDLKTEGVEVVGDMSKTEAEVLIARNVPSESFTPVELEDGLLKQTFFVFFNEYHFKSGTKAYFSKGKLEGSRKAKVQIDSPKMQQYDLWLKGVNKKKELDSANNKIDSIESAEAVRDFNPTTSKPSKLPPKPEHLLPIGDPSASDSSSAMPPPPDIYRDLSAVSGGAAMGQDASFASMGTALGRYQHKLYLAIGSRWNMKVQQTMAQMPSLDRVVVRFQVNADGTVSDIDFVQGNPNSILGTISADSVKQSSNLIGPFPADLKAEQPNGFPWQLAFRTYKSGD